MISSSRVLTPYEQNQLRRFGKQNLTIKEIGASPIEYITGKVEFYGRVFDVTKDTLIPRVETEELVTLCLSVLERKPLSETVVIADIGTGAGAIGITLILELLKKGYQVEAYLSDISEKALSVAQQNYSNLLKTPQPKTHFIVSNLLNSFPKVTFDLIAANLPYIPAPRIDYLDASVKDFEPRVALDGGTQGLTLIHQLLSQAQPYLKPEAQIVMEIDHTHTASDLIPREVPAKALLVKDSFGQYRFARVKFP